MLSAAESLTPTLLGGEGGFFPEPDEAEPPTERLGPQPGWAPYSSSLSISYDD